MCQKYIYYYVCLCECIFINNIFTNSCGNKLNFRKLKKKLTQTFVKSDHFESPVCEFFLVMLKQGFYFNSVDIRHYKQYELCE